MSFEVLKKQALIGEWAKKFMASQEYLHLDEYVLKNIEDDAMRLLRNSKTDTERIEAQQMSLCVVKLRSYLTRLITEGDAAVFQLTSNPQEGENG